jgi:hypothetical protein
MVTNPRVAWGHTCLLHGWLHCPSQEVSHDCHENAGRQHCRQWERKHVCLWTPL